MPGRACRDRSRTRPNGSPRPSRGSVWTTAGTLGSRTRGGRVWRPARRGGGPARRSAGGRSGYRKLHGCLRVECSMLCTSSRRTAWMTAAPRWPRPTWCSARPCSTAPANASPPPPPCCTRGGAPRRSSTTSPHCAWHLVERTLPRLVPPGLEFLEDPGPAWSLAGVGATVTTSASRRAPPTGATTTCPHRRPDVRRPHPRRRQGGRVAPAGGGGVRRPRHDRQRPRGRRRLPGDSGGPLHVPVPTAGSARPASSASARRAPCSAPSVPARCTTST